MKDEQIQFVDGERITHTEDLKALILARHMPMSKYFVERKTRKQPSITLIEILHDLVRTVRDVERSSKKLGGVVYEGVKT